MGEVTIYKRLPNFFAQPYDAQLVLGVTMQGIPWEWDEITLVGYLQSYGCVFGGDVIRLVSIWIQESPDDGDTDGNNRRAHAVCSNLFVKQKLMKMRIVPVIIDDHLELGKRKCQVITIRPYCFWVKLSQVTLPVPYMLPKYGSHDVLCETFEAQLLTRQDASRPAITTVLISAGILPKSIRGTPWDSVLAAELWMREMKRPFGSPSVSATGECSSMSDALVAQLEILHMALLKHVPPLYDISDAAIYSADWNNIFTSNSMWPWEKQQAAIGYMPRDANPLLGVDENTTRGHGDTSPATASDCISTSLESTSKQAIKCRRYARRCDRNAGCIRYEGNRKRWVVDLSANGRRLQKCFHETYFGLIGGLQEARRWRLNYIKETTGVFFPRVERKFVADLIDKILAMPPCYHDTLIRALKTPIPGFEVVVDNDMIDALIQEKSKPDAPSGD